MPIASARFRQLPKIGAAAALVLTMVEPAWAEEAPAIALLAPAPDSEVISKRPEIRIGLAAVPPWEAMLVLLDNVDITALLEPQENGFSYSPVQILGAGRHQLSVTLLLADGRQVEQSFANSLKHLGTERVDSYVLHGPTTSVGLTPDDWAAWQAIEAIHDSGRVRFIGVSNCNLGQLRSLCDEARIQPRFVQNRCYAVQGWDRHLREFCAANDLLYQGFSLLTANRKALASPELARIAERHGRTAPQIVFRFAVEVGMIPLTGTTDTEHMWADLNVFDFRLAPAEVDLIESLESQ